MPKLLHFAASAASADHLHRCSAVRTFLNARIKWVRDPYLDAAVAREHHLQSVLSLKNLILAQPPNPVPSLPLSSTPAKNTFFLKFPFIFKIFQPRPKSPPHVKLARRALALHNDEMLVLGMSHHRRAAAESLTKLLMLTRSCKLPLHLVQRFAYDLGLPSDYLSTLLLEFPDQFALSDMGFRDDAGAVVLGIELVQLRDRFAVSEMQRQNNDSIMHVKYSMKFPNGFDLEKRVLQWVEEHWQNLPYISPYENAFHLTANGDHAEKWVVGIVHELLSLLATKKTELANIFHLADFWGLERARVKKAIVRFPGIFYVSNKIRTQTVVLREAFEKRSLARKHPLVEVRLRYVKVMNLVLRKGRPIRNVGARDEVQKVKRKKDDGNVMSRRDAYC